MATPRKKSFAQFSFVLHLGTGGYHGLQAGFQECSGAGVDFTVGEYHKSRPTGDTTHRIMGLNKFGNVTLKHGVASASDFSLWLEDIRQSNTGALRNVTIHLQSEDRTEVVRSWRLMRARIIKHVSGPMNARSTDVAMEELTLAYERIEVG